MIIARAPLRIPFAGGLTDVKQYAARFGGATISSTVQLGTWVTMLPSVDGSFEVHTPSGVERAASLDGIENEVVRESLRMVNPDHPPVRLSVWLDVLTGSGVGSSGAMAVALVRAADAFNGGGEMSIEEVASAAAHVEVEVLEGASGYHDAHISARGGLLRMDYQGSKVIAQRISMTPEARAAFENSLMLFETGWRASTKSSLRTMTSNLAAALPVLHDMKQLVDQLEPALVSGDLAATAWCIAEQQRLKQLLPGNFVDERVTDVVGRMQRLGVAGQLPGGKISGYLIVCCPDGQQQHVRDALPDLKEVPLALTSAGATMAKWLG